MPVLKGRIHAGCKPGLARHFSRHQLRQIRATGLPPSPMRYRLITFLVFGAILTVVGEWDLRHNRFDFTRRLDSRWLEFCAGNVPDRITKPAVTLIAIDDEYQPLIEDKFSRLDCAAILDALDDFEPPAVAFEPAVSFDESRAIMPLKEAALKLPRIVLGATVEDGPAPAKAPKLTFHPLTKVSGDIAKVPLFTHTASGPDEELLANGDPAFTRIELQEDAVSGLVDSIPLLARQGDQIVPSFVVAALAATLPGGLDNVEVKLPAAGQPKGTIQIGEHLRIPIDSRGHMKTFRHNGLAEAQIKRISASEMFLADSTDPAVKAQQLDLQDEFASLKENLVVIGNDHSADRHVSVDGETKLSQVGLLTRALATIQSGRFISQWSSLGRVLGILVILGLAFMLFRKNRGAVLGWGLLGTFLFFGIVMLIFKNTLLWTPPFVFMGLLGVMIVSGLILPASFSPSKEE